MNLYYVHINEDGEYVETYESAVKAAQMLDQYPGDTIKVSLTKDYNDPEPEMNTYSVTLTRYYDASNEEEAEDMMREDLSTYAGTRSMHFETEIV